MSFNSRDINWSGAGLKGLKPIYIKVSLPIPSINESTVATLYSLKDMEIQSGNKITFSFEYVEPDLHQDLMKIYNIEVNDSTIKEHVSKNIKLYGVNDSFKKIAELLVKAIESKEGTVINGDADIGMFLPSDSNLSNYGINYKEEYLQLKLNWVVFKGKYVRLSFANYAIVRKAEDVMDYVRKKATEKDMIDIYQKKRALGSKVNPLVNSSQLIIEGSPEEMVLNLLQFKPFTDGYLKQERDGGEIYLTMRAEESRLFSEIIYQLERKGPDRSK